MFVFSSLPTTSPNQICAFHTFWRSLVSCEFQHNLQIRSFVSCEFQHNLNNYPIETSSWFCFYYATNQTKSNTCQALSYIFSPLTRFSYEFQHNLHIYPIETYTLSLTWHYYESNTCQALSYIFRRSLVFHASFNTTSTCKQSN